MAVGRKQVVGFSPSILTGNNQRVIPLKPLSPGIIYNTCLLGEDGWMDGYYRVLMYTKKIDTQPS